MIKKITSRIRILPIFIFFAVLMLSIRVNTVFDLLKQKETKTISISQQVAQAQEDMKKENNDLNKVLNSSTSAAGSASAPNNSFRNQKF